MVMHSITDLQVGRFEPWLASPLAAPAGLSALLDYTKGWTSNIMPWGMLRE